MAFEAYIYGDELIAEHHACIVDGVPAVWAGNRYDVGLDGVERALLGMEKRLTERNRREVYSYIRLQAPEKAPAPPYLAAFSNGVLDMRSGGMVPIDPEHHRIFNTIPHEYRADAYDARTDAFLEEVSCGDAAIRANLEETVGLCLYRSNAYGRMVLLLNSHGSNGKSMFIKALRAALGAENTASLDVRTIGMRFMAGQLTGKLANLGDDISNESLSGDTMSVVKKIVTGERMFTDTKGVKGFEFTPYCTMVFSANEVPRMKDYGNGVLRRLHPIPFNAVFSMEAGNLDPELERKITSEAASEYLLRLGVGGIQRVLESGGMTPNSASRRAVQEVRLDNDSILAWVTDCGIGPGRLQGRLSSCVYREYKDWCLDSGRQPKSAGALNKWLLKEYGITRKDGRAAEGRGQCYVLSHSDD